MARVAALTGISPDALLELDGPTWRELVRAVDARWTHVDEMLAFHAELLWELIRITIASNGQRPPAQLRLPRPHDEQPKPRRKSTASEVAAFARAQGKVIAHG